MDYGYSAHRRTVAHVSGKVVNRKGERTGEAFVHDDTIRILENRVNGSLRSVTVLDADGRALVRLDGETARY